MAAAKKVYAVATKADEAVVPVHLWDQQALRLPEEDNKLRACPKAVEPLQLSRKGSKFLATSMPPLLERENPPRLMLLLGIELAVKVSCLRGPGHLVTHHLQLKVVLTCTRALQHVPMYGDPRLTRARASRMYVRVPI